MHNHPWKKFLYALSFIGACLLTGAMAFAQLQAGRIVGQVFDPQHAAVPGATVTVTNSATNESVVVKSDASGNYVVTPLNPGIYSVSVGAQGFETLVRSGVELTVGQAAEVDLSLRIGAANAKVEVTTEGPILETQSGSLDMTVTNTQVESLPLNGRQFTQLAELSPGVAPLPASGNSQNVRPESLNGNVFDGINGQESDFLLDGGDITAHHEGGTQIMTSIDATQEYNVESSPYSAEYTGVGAAFNTTTKSGGDKFHGDLFEYVRNQTTDARGFFALAIPELKRNQFGGTIGGPLTLPKIHTANKTFFFASYEGNRLVQGLTSNVPVPTMAQLGRRLQRNGAACNLRPNDHHGGRDPHAVYGQQDSFGRDLLGRNLFRQAYSVAEFSKRAELHFESSRLLSLRQLHAARGSSHPQHQQGVREVQYGPKPRERRFSVSGIGIRIS